MGTKKTANSFTHFIGLMNSKIYQYAFVTPPRGNISSTPIIVKGHVIIYSAQLRLFFQKQFKNVIGVVSTFQESQLIIIVQVIEA